MPGPVLEWRQAARDDLLAIVDYISDDNPAAAQALKDEIEAKVSRLPDHPQLYRAGRVAGEDKDVISILRVLHGAQQWPPERD